MGRLEKAFSSHLESQRAYFILELKHPCPGRLKKLIEFTRMQTLEPKRESQIRRDLDTKCRTNKEKKEEQPEVRIYGGWKGREQKQKR